MSYGSKFFKKSRDFKPLYRTLINKIGEERAVNVFKSAGDELDNIMHEFPDVPKGERNHTDNFIFPRVAMYRVLKKELGDNALAMIDELVYYCKKYGEI